MRKLTVLVGAISALVLTTLGGVALADGGARHHDPAAMVQRFDANKDGKLQVTELPERLRARLASADANKDGVLGVDELTAFRAQQAQARFARKDTNKDGAIDASEAGAHWARIQVADANKDGKVTLPELQAARAAGLIQHGEHHGRGRARK